MRDLVEKVVGHVEIIQAFQVPLVIFLIIIAFKASNSLEIRAFKWLGYGFFCNLIYLLDSIYIKIFLDNEADYNQLCVILILNLTGTFFFWVASINWFSYLKRTSNPRHIDHSWHQKINRIKNILLIVLVIITLAIFIDEATGLKKESEWSYSSVIYNFLGLLLTGIFLKKAMSKYLIKYLFSAGFIIWAILQLLTIFGKLGKFNEDYITFVGFTSSLVAKFLIFYGMFSYYIQAPKFEKTLKIFKDILNQTFHEIYLPLHGLGEALESLRSVAPPRRIRKNINLIESEYERVKSIVSVSQDAYSNEIDFWGNPYGFESPKVSTEQKIVNINDLIEIAFRTFKKTGKLEFSISFGRNLFIECIPFEIVQVFENLFKNAFEAYGKNKKKVVWIRTFVEKNFKEKIFEKTLIVEIEDFAGGIPEEIIDFIWERGFTTKVIKSKNAIAGQGLSVVKGIMDKYKKINPIHEISVINQITKFNNQNDYIRGAKFLLKFPKKSLPENII